MKTIYVAESDSNQREELVDYFSSNGLIVVGDSGNGKEVVSQVLSKKPDILLLGLILPEIDGYGVMRQLNEAYCNTKVFVLSSLAKDSFIMKALELGAEFYMIKPVENKDILTNIKNSFNPEPTENIFKKPEKPYRVKTLDEKITNVFITVGIPAHIKGYQFLREAVKLAVEKPDIINSITKKLYPSIAKKYDTSSSKVERAIRHAIEVAWNKGRIENINNIFGLKVYSANEKPTNGEFIALVADKMLIEGV